MRKSPLAVVFYGVGPQPNAAELSCAQHRHILKLVGGQGAKFERCPYAAYDDARPMTLAE